MNYAFSEKTNPRHGNYASYLTGFILSIVLTVIPFIAVMQHFASKSILIAVLVICAITQILVHLVCFLQLSTSSEQQWSLIALVFTLVVIAILVVGSLWIMWHLNYHLIGH